jgi:hypothetical protein
MSQVTQVPVAEGWLLTYDAANRSGTMQKGSATVAVKIDRLATTGEDGSSPAFVIRAGASQYLVDQSRIIRARGPVLEYTGEGNLSTVTGRPAKTYRNVGQSHTLNFRSRFLGRDQKRAMAPEYVPGPQGWIFKSEEVAPPPQNNTQLWSFSGESIVPQDSRNPVTLFEVVVPTSSRLRLATLATTLEPSQLYAKNYVFSLFVGGNDILNPFTPQPQAGLPFPNGIPTQLSPQVEDLPVVGPGTVIKAVVRALSPIAASDVVSMKLQGSLWGDK